MAHKKLLININYQYLYGKEKGKLWEWMDFGIQFKNK
jgi:hypothetical protein